MNCLEYRRLLLTDPRSADAQAVAHRDSCPRCAEHAKQALAFEQALEEAIKVPVDPSLAQRIVLDHKLKDSQRGRRRALAAGVLVLAGAGGVLSMRWLRADPIAVASIDHVIGEPSSFAAQQRVAAADLNAALSLSGASVRSGLAEAVTYLHDCPVPGGWGKHIVVNAPSGRFTLITMPSCPVARRATLARAGLFTVVMPARAGAFAIVADSQRSLAEAERYIAQTVDWRVS